MKNQKSTEHFFSTVELDTLNSIGNSIENLINRITYDYYLCTAIDTKETVCLSQTIDDTATRYICEYNICVHNYIYKLTVELNTYNDTYLVQLKCSNNTLLRTIVIAQNYDLMLNTVVFNLIKYNETMYV